MADVKSRWHVLVFILVSLIVSGCSSQNEDATPTPFGTRSPVGDSRPVTVELVEVAESPDSYEGAYIQLSGQYERLPLLVCGSDAHPSPATWQLTSPEGAIFVSGRESELRRLVPDGLWMTVAGRMTYFEGAVGCGKRARTQQIWYLDVDQIVSPNPIARVTLTPGGIPVSDAGVPVSTLDGGTLTFPETAVSPTPQLTFPTATAIPTATVAATPTPLSLLTPTSLPLTPALTPTTDTSDDEQRTTATPTTASSDDETATVTPGATAITPTSSPTPNGTTTATPTPSSGSTTTTDKGNLVFEEILYGDLTANEQHSWSLNNSITDTLTVHVVGDSQIDVVITVLNALTGDVLTSINDNGVGETELLTFDVINGQYEVIVSSMGGYNGRYSALYTFGSASTKMTMHGLIPYGTTETGILEIDNDQYWVFEGESGDSITADVIPAGSSADLQIELLDQSGRVDDNGPGDAEQITFTLPDDGLYVLYVGEFDWETAVYAITISKN